MKISEEETRGEEGKEQGGREGGGKASFDWDENQFMQMVCGINYGVLGAEDEEGFNGGGAQDLLPLLAVGRLHFELVVEELQRPARNVNAPVANNQHIQSPPLFCSARLSVGDSGLLVKIIFYVSLGMGREGMRWDGEDPEVQQFPDSC